MAAAPDFDTVVIAGDQFNIAYQDDFSVQLVVIANYLMWIARAHRLVRQT